MGEKSLGFLVARTLSLFFAANALRAVADGWGKFEIMTLLACGIPFAIAVGLWFGAPYFGASSGEDQPIAALTVNKLATIFTALVGFGIVFREGADLIQDLIARSLVVGNSKAAPALLFGSSSAEALATQAWGAAFQTALGIALLVSAPYVGRWLCR